MSKRSCETCKHRDELGTMPPCKSCHNFDCFEPLPEDTPQVSQVPEVQSDFDLEDRGYIKRMCDIVVNNLLRNAELDGLALHLGHHPALIALGRGPVNSSKAEVAEAFEAERTAERARYAKVVEALTAISKQTTTKEAEAKGIDHENINFEAGYLSCIETARKALRELDKEDSHDKQA